MVNITICMVMQLKMRGTKSINRMEELFYVMSTRNVLAIGHYRLITLGLSRNVLNGKHGSEWLVISIYRPPLESLELFS